MSKLSFRARALDATKPLPIYNAVDLPDLSEFSTINRTVPQMPTGMEKEEETERHLQDVILAQQTNNANKHIVIPTPENAIHVPYYEKITIRTDRPPSQYIRLPGLSLDEDVPDYDLDSEDEEWLNLQSNEKPLSCLHFERMMDRLEKGSGNTVLSLREAQALLKDDDDLVLAVYDYWLAKRLRLGRALIPVVKQERRDGSASGSNPYLAFRKRTEKMQTRKNRKNDETAYMQMQKLKRDLDKAFTLTNMVKERELKKHSMAEVQRDIFKKRYLLEDWSGSIMTSLCPVATHSATSRQNSSVSNSAWDGSSVLIKMDGGDDYDVHQMGRHEVLVSTGLKRKRKKKYYFPQNSVESPLPPMPSTPDKIHLDQPRLLSERLAAEEELDGKYTFKRKPYVKYCPVRSSSDSWPWEDDEGYSGGGSDGEMEDNSAITRARVPKPKRFRFSRLTLSGQYIGLCRRRVGRGGRAMFDRTAMDFDPDDDPDTDAMETDPAHMATPPNSSTPTAISSPGHTPLSPAQTSPSPIVRQQSEIVGVSSVGARVSGLVRSQSVQVMPSSGVAGGGGVAAEGRGAVEGGGAEKLAQVNQKDAAVSRKSLHFLDLPPSPTSQLDPSSSSSSLPFINQPPPFLDSTEHAQLPYPYSGYHHAVGNGAFAGDNVSLRRLPSTDCEDMMTFSSLPTSHFTLRPSSSDMESAEKSPMQFWTGCGYAPVNSDSWNWNQPSAERFGNERKHWSRRDSSSSSSSFPPPPLPPSAPGNYGYSSFHGTRSHPSKHNTAMSTTATQQQVGTPSPAGQDRAAAQSAGTSGNNNNKRNVSRSSLSVTDSKTIILTNSPAPRPPATPTPAAAASASADKKKETDKALSQQNHRLPASTKSQVSTPNAGDKDKKSLPDTQSEGVKGGVDKVESVGANEVKGGVKEDEKTKARKPENDNKDAKSKSEPASATQTPSNTSDATTPAPAKSNTSKESTEPAKKTEENARKSPSKVVGVWSMRGPANGILSMNTSRGARRKERAEKRKSKSSGPSVDSAKLITSQFATKIPKKDETGSGATTTDVLPPSLGNILVRGTTAAAAAGNRSGSNTPTIIGTTATAANIVAQQKLAGLSTAAAMVTSLGAAAGVGKLPVPLAALAPIVTTTLQENIATATAAATIVSQGSEVKRTNSVADRVGAAGHVILAQPSAGGVVHPAVSTGTNGTSIQEIFSSTKRKLSEGKGQGLKQALAGTVMNHNSILENSANKPLVTPTLKSSSEVT